MNLSITHPRQALRGALKPWQRPQPVNPGSNLPQAPRATLARQHNGTRHHNGRSRSMAIAPEVASPRGAEALYAQVQHFYARQMQLLDAGDTAAWALTFTSDGVFEAGGVPEPVRGRETIENAARATAAEFDRQGVTRRHQISMLAVDPADDGTVRARSYAVVLEIPRGGEVTVRRSTVCDDVLVPADGWWLVRHRKVTRDGLDAP
jgi:3-phenylpropionate/cinnamic acid dioxygenase small subunit